MWSPVPIRGGSLPAKTLSLTFDDGPGPDTVAIARYLAAQGIPATFFFVGRHIREFPESVDAVQELGHTAANHTFSHPHLTDSFLSVAEIRQEVSKTDEQLRALANPVFFRPPYGAWTPRLAHVLAAAESRQHVGPINWDLGGYDFEFWLRGKSIEECGEAYLEEIEKHGRGIVLFHDRNADIPDNAIRNRTYEMIRLFVPRLQARDYSFVPLSVVPAIRKQLNAAGGETAPPGFL
jgi:peptidoglycan/xylan/chitin deacetylase (PgdA/CDA1 family)